MSMTVNSHSRVPPGFRFHPTEEELLNYYLRKKVACEKIDLDVIRDVDLNKLEPWDIQEKCRIGSTPQNDWYFFSHKDKKYPTGTRTNRATAAGFWKATGRDKLIYSSCRRIGMRKTLVFYRGRAPHGQKSDWIMHEYRLDDHSDASSQASASSLMGETMAQEDGWVVCRVFKKKNHHKSIDSLNNSSTITKDSKTQILHSSSDGALDQILQYMGRSCKQESDAITSGVNITIEPTPTNSNGKLRYLLPIDTNMGSTLHERFMKLPALESPKLPSLPNDYPALPDHGCGGQASYLSEIIHAAVGNEAVYQSEPMPGLKDWATLDRLVASHLNCESEASKQSAFFDDPCLAYGPSTAGLLAFSQEFHQHHQSGSGEADLWGFTPSASSSDPICRMSHSPI